MSKIYDWSLTALENGGSDDLINWSEGQAPHTVNNSARGMMQRVKEYLSYNGGALNGVVKNNFSEMRTVIVLENTAFSGYKDGLVLRFKALGQNYGETTVSLDHLQGKVVYKATSEGLVPLSGNEIHHDCIYTLVYDASISGWQLLNPTHTSIFRFRRFPCGFIGIFGMERLPDGWLLCDGRAYSRSVYRNLFATIRTTWGEGDGMTTFNVPDLRGMFLRGFDYFGSVDELERRFSSTQQSSLRHHEHDLGFFDAPDSSSRKKREVFFSDHSLKRKKRFVDEECAGLTGEGSDSCVEELDRIASFSEEETVSMMREPTLSHPFFGHKRVLTPHLLPLRPGEELGVHDHAVKSKSFGGEETRPINVSVSYGIKT